MKMSHNDITPATKAERRKLAMMRLATTTATTKYNLGGREKTRGSRQKAVTLPNVETVKEILEGED